MLDPVRDDVGDGVGGGAGKHLAHKGPRLGGGLLRLGRAVAVSPVAAARRARAMMRGTAPPAAASTRAARTTAAQTPGASAP